MSRDREEACPGILRVGGDLPDTLRILDLDAEAEMLEKIKNELVGFGLTHREAKIYLHLARFGPKKANKIAEELNAHRTETYHALTSLQNKGIVTATIERPIRFIALSFKNAIDKIIKHEKERVRVAEKRSEHLFTLWRSLPDSVAEDAPINQFQIFEGLDQAYGKLDEMKQRVQAEIYIMGSKVSIARLYQHGFLDGLKRLAGRNISIRLVISHDSNRQDIGRRVGSGSVRQAHPSIEPIPNFILVDGNELLFFTSREDAPRKKVSAIWTNYSALTKTMYMLFTEMWSDSED